MNLNILSPYVRLAIHSTLKVPHKISTRILYDYELIYVKDGSCRICIEGTDYLVKKNTVVFLRPDIAHSFHVEETDFVQPHIHFDAVYTENSSKTPISFQNKDTMSTEELSFIQEDLFSGANIPYVFVPEKPQKFQELFFSIIQLYGECPSASLLLKARMIELLALIQEQFHTDTAKDILPSGMVIQNIKSYIDQNFRNILTLDSLSKMFYINKFTLMRKFKDSYGINVMKYYNNKRLEHAKDMLMHTNLSIKAIGEHLHFTDAYSFSRFFKSAAGLSPKEFRKKN